MNTEYADAVAALEGDVDLAVRRALDAGMSHDEVAAELHGLADAWKNEG